MAISSFQVPADAGVLCLILANTAVSVSIVTEIVRSILHAIGIHFKSEEEFSIDSPAMFQHKNALSGSCVAKFRAQIPTIRYGLDDCCQHECSICLMDFEPRTEINHLRCGHVFHTACIEKWLMYWHVTCPLCRDRVMPCEVDEDVDACPM